MSKSVQKITPFLWFDTQAEEAAALYTSLFADSSIDGVVRYGASGPGPEGTAMTVAFRLAGQKFTALNGGPIFKFTEAVSFVVHCDDQAEVDELWTKLTAEGGRESQCGWLKDRYGLSWQIVPSRFIEMVQDPDPGKRGRVMKAMMQMKKLDLAVLEAAYRS